MKTPTIKPNEKMTIHTDGTVSYWCVEIQQWRRTDADSIPACDLATMGNAERRRVLSAGERLLERSR